MRRSSAALLTAVLLLLSACGDDDVQTASSGSDIDATETEVTETATETSTTTTAPAGGGTGSTIPDSELPGEPIELFPYEGAALGVVGVAADDVLNVRTGPGAELDVAYELPPMATGIEATGRNRLIEDSAVWAEITSEGSTGWANVAFLSHLGQVTDITTEIAPTPAELPTAETMLELGQVVAEARASEEPASTITVVDGPTVADLGEITVDVIGLGDDALGGERLHVFATPDEGGDSFTLRTVEATLLCTRGVSDGLCL